MSKSRKKSAASLGAAAMVRKRNRVMSPEARRESARIAVAVRWQRYREDVAAGRITPKLSTYVPGPGRAEYRAWWNMVRRCTVPEHPNWRTHGGRGITVCARWSRFSTFLRDMGYKPSPAHHLARKDKNKGYEPSNCRWALRKRRAATAA